MLSALIRVYTGNIFRFAQSNVDKESHLSDKAMAWVLLKASAYPPLYEQERLFVSFLG